MYACKDTLKRDQAKAKSKSPMLCPSLVFPECSEMTPCYVALRLKNKEVSELLLDTPKHNMETSHMQCLKQ